MGEDNEFVPSLEDLQSSFLLYGLEPPQKGGRVRGRSHVGQEGRQGPGGAAAESGEGQAGQPLASSSRVGWTVDGAWVLSGSSVLFVKAQLYGPL